MVLSDRHWGSLESMSHVLHWQELPVSAALGLHLNSYWELVILLLNTFLNHYSHCSLPQVILDVVFNHTAEGNEQGPTLSFRGLDNRLYYMLAPMGEYYNYSGCGNTFNCNQPVVRQFILDCLRFWVEEYHVDGFRFDLASIMTRAHSAWHPTR